VGNLGDSEAGLEAEPLSLSIGASSGKSERETLLHQGKDEDYSLSL